MLVSRKHSILLKEIPFVSEISLDDWFTSKLLSSLFLIFCDDIFRGTTLEDLPQQNGPRGPLSDGSANQMQAQRDHHTSQGSNQFNANINNSKNETMHSKDTKQGYMKPSQSSASKNDNYTSHPSDGDGAMVDFEDDLDEDDLAALDEEIIREMEEAECEKKKLMKPKAEIVKVRGSKETIIWGFQ